MPFRKRWRWWWRWIVVDDKSKIFCFCNVIRCNPAKINLKYIRVIFYFWCLMINLNFDIRHFHRPKLVNDEWKWPIHRKFCLNHVPTMHYYHLYIQQCIIRNGDIEKRKNGIKLRKKRYSYPQLFMALHMPTIAYFSIDHVSTFYTFRFNVTDSQRRTEKKKKLFIIYLYLCALCAFYALPLLPLASIYRYNYHFVHCSCARQDLFMHLLFTSN